MSDIADATTRSELRPTLYATAASAVVGILACVVIALIAEAAGAPSDFQPLSSYPTLVVIGVVAGALGWNLVRHRSADPRRALTRLVPVVLVVSFIPDVLVGVTKSFAHTTWGGVAALMIMHIAVAAAAVASYLYFLPVGTDRSR